MLVQIYKDYSFYYVYNLYLNKMNRLTDIYLGTTHSQIVYDPLGRMTSKQADGQAVFANASFAAAQGQPARPHAMKSAETAEGVFPSATQEITYTGFDKVKTIAEGGNTLAYTYGYDQQRIRMVENVGDITRTKDYVGVCEYIAEDDGENTTEKTLTYLVGPYGVFAVVEQLNSEEIMHYILKDHLGSWTTITDGEGLVEQELSFDAWGNLRNPATWSGVYNGAPMFDRGFTGHEHLYAFGLINMNGRCYDPLTSSFLSVDAYVQSPDNSQSFNRYAYCMNNPLKYVDPSGWYMTGAMHGSRTSGLGWGDMRYLEPIHTRSDFSNAYHLFNQALYGDDLTDTGSGYGAAFQAGVELYQGTSPGAVWSFSHLINNYVNNPSALNRRDLMNAGITDYTYKTWWSAEGLGGYQYTISFNQGSFSYGNDNYNFGYKGYLDATIWAMDLSVKGTKSTDLNKAIILAQSFGVGNGAKTEIIDYAVRSNYKTARTWNEFRNLRPTQKAWRQVNTLGMTGTKYLKASKLAGKACVLLSTGVEVSQLYNYYESGGLDANVYAKSTLDIAMGVVGLCGPIGFGISLTYFVIDLTTDGFNGWGKMP